ncbi:MAG: MATE family efflux transporter [Spirochaetia bacterium]|jgi:putative MATE family efflux protein|nr:MATE family efflux transporter [Spirochaetia bacterium]
MDRTQQLEHERIPVLLAKYSLPAIAGMLVQALYNITDRVFVGRSVGIDGISALTANFPIMLVLMAFGMLFGIGGSAAFSIYLGEKNTEKAEKVIAGTLFMLVAAILTLSVIGQIFAVKILSLFGSSKQILDLSLDYLRIILAGAVINSFAHAMNNFIRAQGSPGTAMTAMIAGGLTNIMLDYVFIFIFGMGVKGAAIATVISQTLSAAIVFSYLFGKKSYIRIHLKNLVPEIAIVRRILAIGSAPFAMQLASSLTNGLLNNQLQRYGGDGALSIMGMIFSVMTVLFMPVLGLNQGSMPLIGYNFGARRYDRVISTALAAITAATVIMTTGFIITRIWPQELLLLFGKNSGRIMDQGITAMKIFFFMSPLIGFQIVASGMFQAIGKPSLALIMSLSRQVLFLIPLAFIIPYFLGLNGIWLACASSDFLSAIVTALFFIREIAIMKKKHSTQEEG